MNWIFGNKSNEVSASTSMGRRRIGVGIMALAVCAGVAPGVVLAQDAYPNKPVRVIVPFAAGGATDITARVIGDGLSKKWGQPVVMDNRPGAGGTLGAGMVAKSPPDGYTLVLGVTGSHGIAGALYDNLSYDPLNDFEPITPVVSYANAIFVSADTPAKNLQELIALIKKDPEYQTFGADGNGTASHLTMELLKERAGFPSQAVQYKGSSPLLTDLAAGFVKVGITGLPSADAFLKMGKIRLIAVTTDRDYTGRGYKTIAEQGFPGFAAAPWSGFFAPKGTPKAIVDQLAKDIAEIAAQPAVQKRFAELGMTVQTSTPEEYRAALKTETVKWAEAVKISGAKVQ
jgi:tripartite-type tricarboxylate transporter receptor subunit TctC